ncbi:MAG: DUF1573 domain-containing protein [Planctomycetaceae bacterium]|nr:DUF1573 domain-containing protein [Planctomycetaceae bacterium]
MLFLCIIFLSFCSCRENKSNEFGEQPQCAHWSILKCCQLYGIPIAMPFLFEKLPSSPTGHSLFQIAEVLREIGLETEGRQEPETNFKNLSFPLIAHLNNPDHFVVVSGLDDDEIHIFDGDGQRVTNDISLFFERWGGEVLLVKKPSEDKRLPAYLPRVSGVPLIQFESLILDLGTVPATGELVPFEFVFRNVGDSDLIINEVRPDCSCIKSDKPENAIQPNEKGTVRLYYNVQSRNGPFSHNIVVKSNDPQFPILFLTASGWSGTELQVAPDNIRLSRLPSGYEKEILCFIKYTGDAASLDVKVAEVHLLNATLVKYNIKQLTDDVAKQILPNTRMSNRQRGNIHVLELVLSPSGNVGDIVEGIITLESNIQGYERYVLNIRGTIDNIVSAFPEVLDFGTESQENDIQERILTLVNNSSESLKVIKIENLPKDMMVRYPDNDFNEDIDIVFTQYKSDVIQLENDEITIHFQACETGKIYYYKVKIMSHSY